MRLTIRQLCSAIVILDVALFLVASAFNDHSSTSVDGLVWWAALAVFAVLVAIGITIIARYLWTRRGRRAGARGRRRTPR